MFLNRKTTGFITLINLVIVLLIGATIYFTRNPLALLGLFFLQNLPVFQGMSDMDEIDMEIEDDEEDESGMPRPTAPADDYAGTKAGFTGKLKLRSTK